MRLNQYGECYLLELYDSTNDHYFRVDVVERDLASVIKNLNVNVPTAWFSWGMVDYYLNDQWQLDIEITRVDQHLGFTVVWKDVEGVEGTGKTIMYGKPEETADIIERVFDAYRQRINAIGQNMKKESDQFGDV